MAVYASLHCDKILIHYNLLQLLRLNWLQFFEIQQKILIDMEHILFVRLLLYFSLISIFYHKHIIIYIIKKEIIIIKFCAS